MDGLISAESHQAANWHDDKWAFIHPTRGEKKQKNNMCDCIYAFSFKGQPLVFIFVILDLPYWASYNKLPAVFFNDGKRQNYHSMKNLMVNS